MKIRPGSQPMNFNRQGFCNLEPLIQIGNGSMRLQSQFLFPK
jgi:hypothetical protein